MLEEWVKWALEQLPDWLRVPLAWVLTIAALIEAGREIASFLGYFDRFRYGNRKERTLGEEAPASPEPAPRSLPRPSAPPELPALLEWRPPPPSAPAPAPGALTREEVIARIEQGRLDREAATWIFASISGPLPASAKASAQAAFVDAAETINAAPRAGQKEALVMLAQGDVRGAFDRLNSVAADTSHPELLRLLGVLVGPANPELGIEAFTRYAAATSLPSLPLPQQRVFSYALPKGHDIDLGFITGDLAEVYGVDAWVNSENDWWMMARQTDSSISATIRYLAARVDEEGLPRNDPLQKALRPRAYGRVRRCKLGAVSITGSGELLRTHGVKRIIHVAAVRAEPRGNVVVPDPPYLHIQEAVRTAIAAAVREADRYNLLPLRAPFARLRSIVIPLFGTGTARVAPELVTDMLVEALLRAAEELAAKRRAPTLSRLYFVAYTMREYIPLLRSFEKRVAAGELLPRPGEAERLA